MKSTIAIVTDSTADIPENVLQEHSIHMVNNLVIIDGHSYQDRVDISRQEFYQKLPGMKTFPSTATASPGLYQTLYEKLLQGGVEFILSIHASSKLSGIYNAARLAAQAFNERVTVVDSQNISMGLGFQVIVAAEAVQEGLPIHAILKKIVNLRNRLHLVAMLDTLEYIRRSGRVAWMRARLGDMLQIKPLLEVKHGDVLSLGEVRTHRKGIIRLIGMIKSLEPLERLAILHTNAEQDALELLESITLNNLSMKFIVNVTTVIGSHVGPKGLGFTAIKAN